MSKPVYFVQECPTCGRALEIRVAHLGKRVICQHCLAEFEAFDPANRQQAHPQHTSEELLHRAEELLASVDRQQARA